MFYYKFYREKKIITFNFADGHHKVTSERVNTLIEGLQVNE